MELGLQHYFTQQNTDARILAYTNNRVIQYNDHIRYLRNQPDEWQVGERLINNASIRLAGEQISVEQELEIIAQDPETEMMYIEDDVFLEIRKTHLRSLHGGDLYDVAVPVNRNHFLSLTRHYASLKNWERMYFLKNTFPDLRQWDAATFHKSQGSTYDAVFIDLANLSTCHQPDVVSRMMYVGFSRARSRVFLYGKLADKYGGLTQ
jgi:exodeoxyribonuclease-5